MLIQFPVLSRSFLQTRAGQTRNALNGALHASINALTCNAFPDRQTAALASLHTVLLSLVICPYELDLPKKPTCMYAC